MRRIAYLTDQDLLGTPGLSSAKPRLTARAVVCDPQGRLAVMHVARFGLYSLPGGGVEEGESIEAALHREIAEETGCTIRSVEPLGYVEENRAHADYTQLSYYFVVHTASDVLSPRLTQAEAERGTSVQWHTFEEAWERIATPVFQRPQGKFLQARDMAALRAYEVHRSVTVRRLTPDMPEWAMLADYAESCGWVAGPHLAGMLREQRFTSWECPFAAFRSGAIVGYCTFMQTDYYPENRYWPWISSIFVDEGHRGLGICGQLIEAAAAYGRSCGFDTAYIPTDMTGFYERYGFCCIDELVNYGGDVDQVLKRTL